MSHQNSGLRPDWLSPPGETITEILVERAWTEFDLARHAEFTPMLVHLLVRGIAPVTPEIAAQLEAVLGSPAGFWLRREATYRDALKRRGKAPTDFQRKQRRGRSRRAPSSKTAVRR